MKKIILMGRVGSGKTTLTQALRGEAIHYHKTQYVQHTDVVIDTPGEYAENQILGRALALYTYEADVVGLLLSATEPYSLYPPCVASCCNREVIGIVTHIDEKNGAPSGRTAGCSWRGVRRSFGSTAAPEKGWTASWTISARPAARLLTGQPGIWGAVQ